MMDPVVQSKYGKRPLLEVPAIQVDAGNSTMEVWSLKDNTVTQSDPYRFAGLLQPAVSLTAQDPTGVYPIQQLQSHVVPSMRMQTPTQQIVDTSGKMIPFSTSYKPPIPQVYPGVHNPFQSQSYSPAIPQQLQHSEVQHLQDNFCMEGTLEYGLLTTIRQANRTSSFTPLPDFLSRELQISYGRYPITHVRIVRQNGEYFIYSTPDTEADDMYSKEYNDNATMRTIGFNEVRGQPK